MGGFHLGKSTLSESDAIKLIHSGVDRGINFLDNSWDYNKGESEKRMGKALAQDGYRKTRSPDDQDRRPDERRSQQTD